MTFILNELNQKTEGKSLFKNKKSEDCTMPFSSICLVTLSFTKYIMTAGSHGLPKQSFWPSYRAEKKQNKKKTKVDVPIIVKDHKPSSN